MQKNDMEILIRAAYPLIWVQTSEEAKTLKYIRDIAGTLGYHVKEWSCTKGLTDNGKVDEETQDPATAVQHLTEEAVQTIFVFKDMHRYLDDNLTCRAIRDVADHLKVKNKTLIVLSPVLKIPAELEKAITVVDIPLPDVDDLKMKFHEVVDPFMARYDAGADAVKAILREQLRDEDAILRAGLGMTETEFENTTARGIAEHRLTVRMMLDSKKDIIRKTGVLEYFETDENVDSIGGLWVLKDWIRRSVKLYTPEAEKFGVQKPKGILLIGAPGTGKSLSAKAIAQSLRQPLLRLDISKITTSLYGESIVRLMMALKLAEALAPCVLWLDELEKMFGTGQGGMHEESLRMLSVLLTHAEECTKPILRVATCNSPEILRPELQQRFKVFYVDMPDLVEREEIFSIHIKKAKRDPANFDLNFLAKNSDGYVGREIALSITEGLSAAFDKGIDLDTDTILREMMKIAPMRKTRSADVEKIRSWAKNNGILVANERPQDENGTSPAVARGAQITA